LFATGLKNLPVEASLKVLDVFCSQKNSQFTKNNLFKSTGSHDKPAILDSINFLHKSKILEINYKGSQTHLISLTQLGHEIVKFILDIRYSGKAYDEYSSKVDEISTIYYESTKRTGKIDANSKNKLKYKKWEHEGIEYLPILVNNLLMIDGLYQRTSCDSIIARFYFIRRKFETNEKTQIILQKIITDSISNYLFQKPELIKNDTIREEIEAVFGFVGLNDSIIGDIEYFYDDIYKTYLDDKQVNEKIRDLFFSLICIIKPSGSTIFGYLDEMKEACDNLMKEKSGGSNQVNARMLLKYKEAMMVADKYIRMNSDYCKRTKGKAFLMTKIRKNRILDYNAKLFQYFEENLDIS
jgi:hypothetical protein